ncbi:hypothetical protein DAPPUDRAFT_323243 [Daphnia pulex]|uniref:Uncharacterized protein n=1 Tax=Daphnia pulex TaxID=6669 RepID=E9GYA9_DAPPU|nr:hypothetical protein DAPPUDRAFT_323243 [Daphnia pulex]|eukprot:EFX75569.1 hypothetical protein DAPPUDRAFT_323243 [Daphnia pulex]
MKPPALMDDDDQVLEPTHAENALSTHAEASKMLEAALQQMDGIIAGTQQELRKLSGSQDSHTAPKSIQEALDQLQDVVEMVGADKKQVFKWVMNVFGLLLDERIIVVLLKHSALLLFISLPIIELQGVSNLES